MASQSPGQMTFWDHLQELRVRLIRCLLIVAGAFVFVYGFSALPTGMKQEKWSLKRTVPPGLAAIAG